MKKMLLLAAVTLVISIGIYEFNDRASFKKVHILPYDVQINVDTDLRLQQIYRNNYSFIVFHSPGIVEHDLKVEGDMVKMLLNVSDEGAHNELQQYSYKLETGEEHDKIAVFLDGQLIPFDNVVAGK
ncbi:hypothetical protein [Planococcus citreus]|uniref:Uncharacterized protein n=1 Tax=Planococcus citreus TaxID=1373 RepID=A0A497YWE6_9BACL|nr:hypothetical protein [Planococcus citreus]RLJ91234.1 hypothetical protein DFR62_1392 [Planococcus citreus]